MKTILLLLLPLILCSQNNYPDTLYMINGKTYPAMITGLDEVIVKLIYKDNRQSSSSGLNSFDKIVLENFGTVYEKESGFKTDLDTIQEFIELRLGEIEKLEQAKIAALERSDTTNKDTTKTESISHWSFGILYVPDHSILLNEYIFDGYSGQIYLIANTKNVKLFEGHFAIYLNDYIAIESYFAYKSININDKSETHYRYDYSPDNNNEYGEKLTENIQSYFINIGIKYYFLKLSVKKVSPFLFAGFGKQFTDYKSKTTDLYPDDEEPNEIIDRNYYEFISDINSPYNINFGFGSEYLFNDAISLYANMRFRYTMRSGNYKYRQVRIDYRTITQSQKSYLDDLDTHIGIGLNLYIK